MRAWTSSSDLSKGQPSGLRHAVDDAAVWGARDALCGIRTGRDEGPWDPEFGRNCRRCVRVLDEEAGMPSLTGPSSLSSQSVTSSASEGSRG